MSSSKSSITSTGFDLGFVLVLVLPLAFDFALAFGFTLALVLALVLPLTFDFALTFGFALVYGSSELSTNSATFLEVDAISAAISISELAAFSILALLPSEIDKLIVDNTPRISVFNFFKAIFMESTCSDTAPCAPIIPIVKILPSSLLQTLLLGQGFDF